jgi:HPt (histidine-containing phosphotransfer) domain-containing protein
MDGFISKPINAEALEAALTTRICEPPAVHTPDVPSQNEDFDRSVVEHLRSLDDDGSLFHELVTMFRTDFGDQLANLRAAVAAKDASSVRGVAHKMKGSTGLLGLTTLTTELAAVEHGFEELGALTPRINNVQALFKDAIRYLTECDVQVA